MRRPSVVVSLACAVVTRLANSAPRAMDDRGTGVLAAGINISGELALSCRMWRNVLLWFVSGAAFALPTLATAAPSLGNSAPPLNFKEVLQAPRGSGMNWNGLRGKTVVLEFWATWCGPCLAVLPHLNELSDRYSREGVQFIAVDDEPEETVKTFLQKRPIAGWVALDRDDSTFRRYGVASRPTTIVVTPLRRIAFRGSPDQLDDASLRRILDSQNAVPNQQGTSAAVQQRSNPVKGDAIFTSELRIAPADEVYSMISGDGALEMHGASAVQMISLAFDAHPGRMIVEVPLSTEKYDFVARSRASKDGFFLTQALQASVSASFDIKPTWKPQSVMAFVLTKVPGSTVQLPTTASTGGSFRSFRNGTLRMVNVTADDIAIELGEITGQTYVNETGLQGRYDVTLSLPQTDSVSISVVFRTALGLSITSAERPVNMLVIAKNGQ